jgi:hypothetical protein
MMYGERGLLDLSMTKALMRRRFECRQFATDLVGDAVDPDSSATRLPLRTHQPPRSVPPMK